MRRHPPDLRDLDLKSPEGVRCKRCRRDVLDPVHWPPRGWREKLLELFGLLREP